DDLVYVVGKSDPTKDWVAVQPGAHNAGAGSRPHPFTVQFDLKEVPAGLYSMRIAVLTNAMRVPWLQVEVNGYTCLFLRRARFNWFAIAIPPKTGSPCNRGLITRGRGPGRIPSRSSST